MTTAGFVLTGGMSTRMGRDKALLEWEERPLIECLARNVREAAGSVALVGAPERYRSFPFPAIADRYRDCGPVAGIEAALSSSYAASFNLIVACDLPDLLSRPELTEGLMERALASDALCVAGQDASGQLHPLFAVYRREALEQVQKFARGGNRRLTDLFKALGGETWPMDNVLANVNAPEDWVAWQKK